MPDFGYQAQKLIGLAASTKPLNVDDGVDFFESDTFATWSKISGAWKETTKYLPDDYIISRASSSLYKATNTAKGYVDITNTNADLGQLVLDVISSLPNGGKIFIKPSGASSYKIKTPIVITPADAGTVRPYVISSYSPSARFNGGSTIEIDSTFPTQRYVFESVAGTTSNNTANISLSSFFVYNSFAKSGTTGQNIQGASTVIDAGLVKYGSNHTNGLPFLLDNVTTQYLWRGIHLLGYQYFGKIHNYFVESFNINEVTDCDLIMERGGYSDYPKMYDINHMFLAHQGGAAGGTGSVNIAACLGGAYNNIRNGYVDGTKYNEACVAIKQGWSNTIYGFGTIDLNVAQGPSNKGTWVIDTKDFSGIDGTHSPNEWTTYNNQLYDIYGSSIPYGLAFLNGAYRNRIKIYGFWGGNLVIDDAGAGIENVVEVIEGQQPSWVANGKTTTTSNPSKVKIVDLRMGTKNRGTAIFSGDDSTKVFNIPHGLWATPGTYNIERLSIDSQGGIDITVTSTNIVVTYKGFAPPTGTNNVKLGWYANVY
jgi:hypothetical protein